MHFDTDGLTFWKLSKTIDDDSQSMCTMSMSMSPFLPNLHSPRYLHCKTDTLPGFPNIIELTDILAKVIFTFQI